MLATGSTETNEYKTPTPSAGKEFRREKKREKVFEKNWAVLHFKDLPSFFFRDKKGEGVSYVGGGGKRLEIQFFEKKKRGEKRANHAMPQ
jgi:hypothetical protein